MLGTAELRMRSALRAKVEVWAPCQARGIGEGVGEDGMAEYGRRRREGCGGGTPSAFGTSPCKGEEMGLGGGRKREMRARGRAECRGPILHMMYGVRMRLALRAKVEVWAPCQARGIGGRGKGSAGVVGYQVSM